MNIITKIVSDEKYRYILQFSHEYIYPIVVLDMEDTQCVPIEYNNDSAYLFRSLYILAQEEVKYAFSIIKYDKLGCQKQIMQGLTYISAYEEGRQND